MNLMQCVCGGRGGRVNIIIVSLNWGDVYVLGQKLIENRKDSLEYTPSVYFGYLPLACTCVSIFPGVLQKHQKLGSWSAPRTLRRFHLADFPRTVFL